MQKNQQRQFDPNTFAVLHRTGRNWRAVVAHAPQSGRGADTQGSDKSRVVAYQTFPEMEISGLDAWLDGHEVGKVICVLHAPSVICRTCPLPDAQREHLGAALRLQAEAHLFGIAPPHRMGMAVLESAPGETSRSGIILAWPESAEADRPPTSREVQYAPDVAALACLLDGLRPTKPLAWVDREDGSLALAVAHASGAVFRGLREDASDVDAWTNAIGRVLAETCLSVGHTASFVESLVSSAKSEIANMQASEAKLLAPQEVIDRAQSRLDNVSHDPAWWATYGIAAGIVIAHTSDLAPLTKLRKAAPVARQTTLTTVVQALSTPKATAIAVVACVFVLMFGSLIFNGLRLAILQIKHPEATRYTELAKISAIRNQIVMYRELNQNSWSTTKILSDIVSNTPEGIELEFIRINPQRSFSVRGRAIRHGSRSATEVIGLMRQLLNDSGIFHDAALNWREPDAYGAYQFDLSASMVRPYRRFQYPEELDFGQWTLADRMRGLRPSERDQQAELAAARAGEEVAKTISGLIGVEFDEPTDAQDDLDLVADPLYDADDPELHDDRPTTLVRGPDFGRVGSGSGRDTAGSVTDRAGGPVASAVHDIPPPMTKEQIDLMSEPEVRDTLNRVAAARQLAVTRQDPELQARLRQEFEWLMDRVRSFQ